MWIYAVVIFLLVTGVTMTLLTWLVPNRSQRRLHELAAGEVKTDWVKTVVDIASPLAKLSIPEGKWEDSPVRLRFINAGIRTANAVIIFYGAKTFLPLIFAAAAFIGLQLAGKSLDRNMLLLVLLLAATLGCYLPNIALNRAVRARQREIFDNFPDAADLMLVCVEAGLGLDAALVRVADEIRIKSRALAEEIHLTNLETRAGSSRDQALRNLGLRRIWDCARACRRSIRLRRCWRKRTNSAPASANRCGCFLMTCATNGSCALKNWQRSCPRKCCSRSSCASFPQ
jgi:tight adherence protein C